MVLEDVLEAIRPSAYYYPRTALIAVENTHNRHGGTVLSLSYLKQLRNIADLAGIPIHCDGARIWNAMVATDTIASQYGALFDTMSVCLSKGLGAPVGSLILGTRVMIERARRWRKMLGGGMRQVGILAAAGLYALDVNLPKIINDHTNARSFAESIALLPRIEIDLLRVQTNVVAFRVPSMTDAEFIASCSEKGLRVAPIKPGAMRAVFYHQISAEETAQAAEIIAEVLRIR